jgi:hypothetical protein
VIPGLAGLLGDSDGLREELRKIAVDDGSLSIDETGVEVALEHGEDTLDVRIGWRFGEKRWQRLREQGAAQGENGRADKVSTLHVYLGCNGNADPF